jgi:hypothetical protein
MWGCNSLALIQVIAHIQNYTVPKTDLRAPVRAVEAEFMFKLAPVRALFALVFRFYLHLGVLFLFLRGVGGLERCVAGC